MSNEHKPMIDDELDAIKGRLAAITEWPWIAFCRTGVSHRMGITNKRLFDDGDAPEVLDVVELGDNAGGIKSEADAVFIANAPTDIARLLAEVERLRKEHHWLLWELAKTNTRPLFCPMPDGYECLYHAGDECKSIDDKMRVGCWRTAVECAVKCVEKKDNAE